MSSIFDGKRFYNQNKAVRTKTFKDFLAWQFKTTKNPWPEKINTIVQDYQPNHHHAPLRYGYINHATVLLEIEGVTFLTDPVFSQRVSPVQWAGPKRVRPPAINIDTLPKIDMVLLSHNHYDHMDIASLKWLSHRDRPLIITGLKNSHYLHKHGITHIHELDWYQHYTHKDFDIYFEPAQHWSKRHLKDESKALWGAFMVRSPQHRHIYFAGDTGYYHHFKETAKRHGHCDLALLPIGAYEPRWFMKDHHMNPDDAVQAHIDLQAKHSIAIHFGTFRLTNEGICDPEKDLMIALEKYAINSRDFVIPQWGKMAVVK